MGYSKYRTSSLWNTMRSIVRITKRSIKEENNILTRLRVGHTMLNKTLKIINKHSTRLCEHCGVEESVEHIICVCHKYSNEREIMKNELGKMGMDELKLINRVTCGLESLFLQISVIVLFKRTVFIWNRHFWQHYKCCYCHFSHFTYCHISI